MANTDTETAETPKAAKPPGGGPDTSEAFKKKGLSESALARVFVSPSIALIALVAMFPIIYAVVLSLLSYQGRQNEGFGGIENYVEGLADPRFWESLEFTFLFSVVSVAFEFAIGMGFALLMNQAMRGRGITRAAILIPWVIPTVIAAQMWHSMFNVSPGFINTVFGLGDFNWLGQPGWATFAVIFADVWKTAPFVALLLLAGLQTIPADVYESSRVDGAGAWQRFWHITLPLLKPAILVALLFRTVESLRVYDLPAVMTGGAHGTEPLSMLVRHFIIVNPDPGMSSALSTVTFIVILGVGMIFVTLLGRDLVIGKEDR
ncbi:MAG: carbohydrate ABC transporter permease [Stackebrandtia sp.]